MKNTICSVICLTGFNSVHFVVHTPNVYFIFIQFILYLHNYARAVCITICDAKYAQRTSGPGENLVVSRERCTRNCITIAHMSRHASGARIIYVINRQWRQIFRERYDYNVYVNQHRRIGFTCEYCVSSTSIPPGVLAFPRGACLLRYSFFFFFFANKTDPDRLIAILFRETYNAPLHA